MRTVLADSDTVFVVASVTSDNQGFLGAEAFARMRPGAAFILLSRAGVVDFRALMEAVRSGRIRAASDVFPEEPLAPGHPVRTLPGFLRSAHRAGALDVAFKRMGDMVLEEHGSPRPRPAAAALQARRTRDRRRACAPPGHQQLERPFPRPGLSAGARRLVGGSAASAARVPVRPARGCASRRRPEGPSPQQSSKDFILA